MLAARHHLDDHGESSLFLTLLRTQEDASSHIAKYLTLQDLHHAVLSCKTALVSALRHQALRTTRLHLPPDATRTEVIVSSMQRSVVPYVKDLEVADTRSVEALAGRLPSVRKLRINSDRFMLRDDPRFDLSHLRQFPSLVELDLSAAGDLVDISGLEGLTSLRYLDLAHTAVHDITAVSSLPQLVELNLDTTPVASIQPLEGLTQLRVLNLSYTQQLRDLSPLRSLTRVRELMLNQKSILEVDSLLHIAGNLEHLEIADANVQSLSIEAREELVSALVNVDYLDLSWSRFIFRLDALMPLKRMRVLKLSGEKFADLAPLSSLPQLEELAIKQDVDVDLSVVGTLTNLRKLIIFGFRPHTSSVEFLGALPYLKQLEVSSLFRLGFPKLPHLKRLGVTVLSYSEYFKYPSAPNLTKLSIYSRVDINQVNQRFPYLRHLHLEEVDRISLHSLAQFTQLETLEIGRRSTSSQPFPEDHSFLRPLKQLRVLRILWTNITDLFVLTGMTALRELDLEGTPVRDVWHLTALTSLEKLSLGETKVRNIADLTMLKNLKSITIPKHASCAPLQDMFHSGAGLEHLREVIHPGQNCLWGRHRTQW
ncbi:hypothetical protein Poli38472_011138 [Pythium oligandrum]|uniref:Uncharacterized protein n=1 Tax=Pythium oligandrum TaxID=41045 RepID=A0A8K1CR89_PYTOL|nr:hypothetical protein Poli38472_011138 [Pythium oligandrum]|eukprot:TMW67518.1 hypothetical protein Poli38472_011138 [Pythium oligandrum]